ncbi:zinc finger protein 24-like [Dromiciops gliroides]|uniref:zinc finger protein 24-like n=1 Tax=Dromiciops gliroides TaxID=33562 RepID=UPI001CC57CB1|nr:zinc finger protein 24-like [Dromiciops gliroides]
MEGKGCSSGIGAENRDGQLKLLPRVVMPETKASPLEEAVPLMVGREEDSTQDRDTTNNPEVLQQYEAQQRFRRFRYKDATGPRQLLQHLRELSRRWLDPEVHTKEQIMELLVQEQFRAISPEALQPPTQR